MFNFASKLINTVIGTEEPQSAGGQPQGGPRPAAPGHARAPMPQPGGPVPGMAPPRQAGPPQPRIRGPRPGGGPMRPAGPTSGDPRFIRGAGPPGGPRGPRPMRGPGPHPRTAGSNGPVGMRPSGPRFPGPDVPPQTALTHTPVPNTGKCAVRWQLTWGLPVTVAWQAIASSAIAQSHPA